MDTDFVTVAQLGQLPAIGGFQVTVNGRKITLFKAESGVYATDSFCPHKGGPMFAGFVQDGKVYCPLHGWDFDVRTGICRDHPERPINCYEVRVVGEDVQVKVPKDSY